MCGALWMILALAGMQMLEGDFLRASAYAIGVVGFAVSIRNSIAAMKRRPMLKVLDDRFSVYTPFGYAVIRFGEVLEFKKGGLPFMRSLRIVINGAARPRFPSGLNRLMYSIVWLSFANSVAIKGYMLGTNVDSVIQMLEKRRLAAVRMQEVEGFETVAAAG